MTARCDDLWLQLEYLNTEIAHLIATLTKPPSAERARSWATDFLAVITTPTALEGFTEEARQGSIRRGAIAADLKAVRRFKERLRPSTCSSATPRWCRGSSGGSPTPARSGTRPTPASPTSFRGASATWAPGCR